MNAEGATARRDHARPTDTARALDSNGSFAGGQGGTVVHEDVDAYALRGRGDAGLQAEATDLPNLVGKVGRGGGGMDGFIHDRREPAPDARHDPREPGGDGTEPFTFDWQAGGHGDETWRGKSRQWIADKPGTARPLSNTKVPAVYDPEEGDPEAFLPRHFTRGKDGAPGPDVPPLTSEMDRGDGHAMVHYGFQSTLGSLSADGIEEDATPPLVAATPMAAAIPPTMFDASSQHGREGVGTGVPNMADPGESLALTSRADRYAMFGIDPADPEHLATSPYDPLPDGPRYAAMGDAVTVPVLHWIGAKFVAEAEAHGGLYHVPTTGAPTP